MVGGVADCAKRAIASSTWESWPRSDAGRGHAAGWFTTPLLPDDLLGTLNPLWSTTEPHAKVVGLRRETADTTTLLLRTGSVHPAHRPGQFVGIGTRLDGVWHWRTYSVTSRPADPLLAITVTALPGGAVSGALAHRTPVGALLRIGPPAGEFVLPDPVPEKLLFLTAGSGITPVMGMLRELAATRPEALAGAVLVHCDRTPADLVFGAELRALAASTGLRLVERHTAATGRLTPDRWPTRCRTGRPGRPGPADRPACWTPSPTTGSGPATRTRCTSNGSPRPPRSPPAPPVAGSGSPPAGIEADAGPGTPLMAAGEAAGAVLPSGCRMGICHTCVGRLRSGAVRNLHTGATARHPRRSRRTCVSGAAGDVEIEL